MVSDAGATAAEGGTPAPPPDLAPGRWRATNVPVPEQHVVALVAAALLQRRWAWKLPGPRRLHRLLGWPLAVSGVVLALRSVRAAGDLDIERADRLLQHGPYARTRNPMYLAWALLHVGLGLAAGSGWLVASYPAAAAAIHREVLREERALAATFGADLERYAAIVPRYLPRVRTDRSAR